IVSLALTPSAAIVSLALTTAAATVSLALTTAAVTVSLALTAAAHLPLLHDGRPVRGRDDPVTLELLRLPRREAFGPVLLVVARRDLDQRHRHIPSLHDYPPTAVVARVIPVRAAAVPIPTIDEENFLLVLGHHLNARTDHDERRRHLESDGRRRDVHANLRVRGPSRNYPHPEHDCHSCTQGTHAPSISAPRVDVQGTEVGRCQPTCLVGRVTRVGREYPENLVRWVLARRDCARIEKRAIDQRAGRVHASTDGVELTPEP